MQALESSYTVKEFGSAARRSGQRFMTRGKKKLKTFKRDGDKLAAAMKAVKKQGRQGKFGRSGSGTVRNTRGNMNDLAQTMPALAEDDAYLHKLPKFDSADVSSLLSRSFKGARKLCRRRRQRLAKVPIKSMPSMARICRKASARRTLWIRWPI